MRRKVKFLAALIGAVAVGAGVAYAVLSVLQTTATDTITARSIGGVNIGDAATKGLFVASLSNIDPGYTVSECTNALLTNPSGSDQPRVWFGGAGGALASKLNVTVAVRNQDVTQAGNGVDCTLDSNYTPAFTGTLADLLSASGKNSYANGIPWRAGANNVQIKVTLTLPSTVDPSTIMGQTAAFAGNFENRPAGS